LVAVSNVDGDSGPAAYRAPDISLLGDDHVRAYEETDGAVGYLWNDAPILVLTTRGHKSGLVRKIAIIFTEVDGDFVIVASNGGADTHPGWFQNILAEPTVSVQVRDRRFRAVAHAAEGEERARLWHEATKTWSNYDTYVTRTDRIIPVVVLHPLDDAPPV
jgi:deazaflavin-dependent oxidoreductase (nitroreductase family)